MGNLLIYSAADNFCIWPPALPRCRLSRVSHGRKPIRRGRCASSSPRPPPAQAISSRVLWVNGSRSGSASNSSSTKWPHHPNLRKKPHAPSKGRGPVQRAIRRAFAASGTEALTSSAIYDWAHIRRRRGRRKSMPFGIYSRTLRTLRTMCDPVERVPPHGAGCGSCATAGTIKGRTEKPSQKHAS
jgi:hypothetical protein